MPQPKMTLAAMREAVELISHHGGNVRAAAKSIGIPESTMYTRQRRAHAEGIYAELPVHRAEPVYEAAVAADRTASREGFDELRGPTIRVRVRPDTGERWKVVAIGDFHSSPSHRDERAKWIGRFAAEVLSAADTNTAIVQIGDFASFDSLSWHDKNDSLSGKAKPSFKEDIEALQEDLSLFSDGLDGFKPDEQHVTLGNHDCPYHGRPFKFMNSTPEMAGVVDFEVKRVFERGEWTYSPFGHHWFLGGVAFTHAPMNILGREIGGELPANQISNKAIYDLVYGHTHKAEDVRRPKIGHGNFVRVVNLGCSLPWGHLESYVNKGAMSGWWWGVHTLEIFGGHVQAVTQTTMQELEGRYS